SAIELCEVKIEATSFLISVSTTPLPPVEGSSMSLRHLMFFSPMDDSKLYLASSYLDFGDYAAAPKSELFIHSLARSSADESR
ncbi:unnamed protein product, partial [Mycena citricolor]